MKAQLDFIGIVVEDMERSLAFYRELGVEAPEGRGDESHVEAPLTGGMRLAWDTRETIRSFDPDWRRRPAGRRSAWRFAATARPR
jgi:hypothetical protein